MKKTIYSISITFLVLVLLYYITGFFLVYNKPIESKYLLLEDWLQCSTIEKAAQYIINNDIDSIWIISMKPKNEKAINLEHINVERQEVKERNGKTILAWEGILTYRLPADKIPDSGILKIRMYGTEVRNIYPHYKVFMNNQLLKTGFITGSDSTYLFSLHKLVADTINLVIYYDNDAITQNLDRNMYIKKVLIDTVKIDDIALERFFIKRSTKVLPLFASTANDIKLYLAELGVNSRKIQILETDYKTLNKTLTLANQAGEFFQNSNIQNINIFTTSIHSRRTYINFRNCINGNIQIGCIASEAENNPKQSRLYENIDERVSLIFSWMYWWFH